MHIEKEIVKRITQGDTKAFEQLYFSSYVYLCSVAIKYVYKPEPARELVNDVFLSVWNNRATLTYPVEAYLISSVQNRCLNYSKVILPDRSVVWMNAGSSLQYNETYSEKTREVHLKGEAYFEVMPDSLKPFVVKSDKLDVRVLGTTFNVRAYEDEDQVDVVLMTGKVDVCMTESLSAGQTYHLLPNEKLSYNKRTAVTDKAHVDAADFCVWINGGMKFVAIPFSQLVSELERKYNISLIVESRSLSESIYSGTFTAEQTVDDILNEINIEGKYEWKQNGNVLTIYDK